MNIHYAKTTALIGIVVRRGTCHESEMAVDYVGAVVVQNIYLKCVASTSTSWSDKDKIWQLESIRV